MARNRPLSARLVSRVLGALRRQGGKASAEVLAPGEPRRLVVCGVTAAVLAIAGPASSQSTPVGSDVRIIQAGSPAELQKKWCASDPQVEHILVLPASLFVDSEQLICEGGPYKLYRIIAHSVPDDFESFLDPPFGSTTRLG